MHSEREMGLIYVYLPGGVGEQRPSSFTAELLDSAWSFTPTPPVCCWFELFSAGLGSWAAPACKGSGPVGSGFFPSVSTGAFPFATASAQQTKALGCSSERKAQPPAGVKDDARSNEAGMNILWSGCRHFNWRHLS